MTADYTNDDTSMYNLYKEGHSHGRMSTGIDQFTPKLARRGNPNTRLSYASFFEEELSGFMSGDQATYIETGDVVNVVDVDEKDMTATIELSDESTLFDVPFSQLEHLD